MTQVTGVIQYVNANPGKFGMMYNVKVNGVAYSTMKDNPETKYGVTKGDNVTFTAAQNDKGYWNVKGGIQKVAQAAVAAEPDPVAEKSGPRLTPAAPYRAAEDAKQKVITRQAARNAAVAFLELAQAAGALPAAKAKGAQYDLLLGLLDTLTVKFYNDSLNPTDEVDAPATSDSPAVQSTVLEE